MTKTIGSRIQLFLMLCLFAICIRAQAADTTKPTVSYVNSTTANGTYKAGTTIAVTVKWSENVIVTGAPRLRLETGATDRYATYASGSGGSTLTFNYAVQAGDASADLDYTATTALELNGGTIKDAAGNTATLTLAAPGATNSLGKNKNIVIDAIAPTVSDVSASTANGTYKAGATIAVTISFNEAVTVTGTPRLLLETGATDRYATYASGSGGSTLTFNYAVQAGDASADLNYPATTALELNSGTIKDAPGNNATLTLAAPGALHSLGINKSIVIDTTAPTVSDVNGTTANGTYKAGATIAVTITFTEAVTVTGAPRLVLETGTTDRYATYASGSGNATLTFNYAVQSGDASADLDYTATSALGLNGGTIKDAVGNSAVLTLATPGAIHSLGANKNIVIDAVAPTFSNATSTMANGSYGVGATITVTIAFNEVVTVTGSPRLLLETGTTDRYATYTGGSGGSTLTFNYVVQAGDAAADLDYKATTALELNGATILDTAGNSAVLTLASPGATHSLGANKAIVIDTVATTVGDVTATTANGTYKAGTTIAVTVVFSEAVTVAGTPRLLLETGATDRYATYASGSGGSTLTFNYIVQAGDSSADLTYTATTALELNGGTIEDAAGNNAALTLAAPTAAHSLGANKNIAIDGIAPTINDVSASTANGAYKAGSGIAVTITFSEPVVVTGAPRIVLETGTTDRRATYSSGSGGSTLTFVYMVQAGDSASNLDYTATTAMDLNGGTLLDVAGNTADLTLVAPGATHSLGANKSIVIDGIAPTVSDVNASTANGSYKAGATISLSVAFSENVTVAGAPRILLETGTTDRYATYAGGSGSSSLTFNYVVQSGDAAAILDYTATTALELNGGTILDTVGNAAVLTLASPGATHSLGANTSIAIDGVPPTVSDVSSGVEDGTYKTGMTVAVTVTFSEAVSVTGLPRLLLETGATDRYATYAGGSGTSSLTFNYMVQVGDAATDLDYSATTALELNGGTILDAAGNSAVLTLASPGATHSLGANKNILIDTTAPAVTDVSSTNADGSYSFGQTLTITVSFSTTVYVSGEPQLLLATGPTNQYATYTGGSESNVLTFTYTVLPSDATTKLDYASIDALESNGATIQDGEGHDANLLLAIPGAAHSLGANKHLVLNTDEPVINDVGSTTTDGLYRVGATISVSVTFSKPVIVTGSPLIIMETGDHDHYATYASGSGTNTLNFNYVVQMGDYSTDLDYNGYDSLDCNGGTMKDSSDNDAYTVLPAPGSDHSLSAHKNLSLDGVTESTVNVSSTAANGSYKAGATIPITISFTGAVNVTGTPRLLMETGDTDRYANYVSGSGTSMLTFNYVAQAGDNSADLCYVGTNSLELNDGTIVNSHLNPSILTLATPGLVYSLKYNKSILIDTIIPVVTDVNSTAVNGPYGVGKTVGVNVIFNKIVTVSGSPRLLLETGATDRYATYARGSGSNTLTFNYVAQASDASADLDYKAVTSLELNGGTIHDAVGNNAIPTLVAPGSAHSLGANKNLVIDTVAPTVINVTSTRADGPCGAGITVPVTVTFSKAVKVTGVPRILLETGAIDRYATYASGSGAATLTFNYVAQSGDASADLDYTGAMAMDLNGGTILDGAGNTANLGLPSPGAAHSLGANKSIVIQTIATKALNVSSTLADGVYGVGKTIPVSVTFDKVVNVTGQPKLSLETGVTDRSAAYASGSGSDTIVFNYIVMAGDAAACLDCVSSSSLRLNGGTIKDVAGNPAALAVPIPGAPGSLSANKSLRIDTVAPVVSNVSSTQDNGSFGLGASIPITVTFSKNVFVTGAPQVVLETGSAKRRANYTGGSETSVLTFVYVVQAGDKSADLDCVNANALVLNGGTIKDLGGNASSLIVPILSAAGSLKTNKNLVIDTVQPKVVTVSSPLNYIIYSVGQTIPVTMTFSKTVLVTGQPTLKLETGATDRNATYASGSGGETLTFNYAIQAGDVSPRLDYYATTALGLNGGTIKDVLGNVAVLTLAAPGAANSLKANNYLVVDTISPTVADVTSSMPNGPYGVGKTVSVSVVFPEVVYVTGDPRLLLETGTTDRYATYDGGSGTASLAFNYTVQAGDQSADLNYATTASLELNGATFNDRAGNNAVVKLPVPTATHSLGTNKSIVIDTVAPTVTNVTSAMNNGTYGTGKAIPITVAFSESVSVTGTPRLQMETGSTDQYATYASGSGTANLIFNYVVQAGDNSADLCYTGTGSLDLNGGTIQDLGGNPSILTLPAPAAPHSLNANKALVIGASAPALLYVSSATANGAYNAGKVISVTIVFNESVVVTGLPWITLETGVTDRHATYAAGSGSDTIILNYVIHSGDVSPDLEYVSVNALELNGGTIKDLAGISGSLVLPAPRAANSLSVNKSIVIDTISPSLNSVSSSAVDGAYGAARTVPINVTFSEKVVVTGTPRVLLNTGGVNRYATYASGSGATVLTFNYVVQAGDISADLDYVSANALELNGGTIMDPAGNSSAITLPAPGAANSLGANKALTIDTVAPVATTVSSTAADGSYGVAMTIPIIVTFSKTMVVSGTPRLKLETGVTDHYATYVGGSGSATLTFNYMVQAGDASPDLDYTSATALELNGSSVKDVPGNKAVLTLPNPGASNSLGANKSIVLDTVLSGASNIQAGSENAVSGGKWLNYE